MGETVRSMTTGSAPHITLRSEFGRFVLDAVAGTIGSVAGVFCGSPFDVIKTRVQNDSLGRPARIILRETWKTEGVRGLFRGSMAASLGLSPTNFIIFGVYGSAVRWFDRVDAAGVVGVPEAASRLFHVYLAGTLSGLAQSFAHAPFEHLKVQQQLMVKPGQPHLGLVDTARGIMQSGGPSHIMRGTLATAIRDGSSFGFYFGSYELCKSEISRALELPEGSPAPEWVMLTAGGIAGVISWQIALPADVVKSVIQGSPITALRSETSIPTVIMRLYRAGGVNAFFR